MKDRCDRKKKKGREAPETDGGKGCIEKGRDDGKTRDVEGRRCVENGSDNDRRREGERPFIKRREDERKMREENGD